MKDPRFDKLADLLIDFSTELRAQDKILIEAFDIPPEMVLSLLQKITRVGGIPFVTIKQGLILRELYKNATETGMKLTGQFEAERMKQMDAYIGLRGSHNIAENSDVPNEKMRLYQQHWWKPVHLDHRVPNTRWVILRWPHPAMAQLAHLSTEAFENFYFDVCTLDYARMDLAMEPLKQRLEAADQVEITGPDTYLKFSIKGLPAVKCSGKRNIPDGEIYTAPVRDSVQGVIRYNAKTIYQGIPFENIRLEFDHGKIVAATADKTEALNKILDTDPGARYIGEFALGFNPYITRPMLDVLFDEKISGSFHFTPGNAYEKTCDNGNRSTVHWDMVCLQTPEFGGGEIYLDGQLIRKDGRFVPNDLLPLNPENLK